MNINKLLRRIKDEIGMTKYLKTTYDDKALYDIIVMHALPDWSYYFKYEFEVDEVTFEEKHVIAPDILALPQYLVDVVERSDLQINDVKKVRFLSHLFNGMSATLGMYAMNSTALDIMDQYAGQNWGQIQGDIDSFMSYRYACWFEKPNVLRFTFPISTLDASYNMGQGDKLFRRCSMSLWVNQANNLLGIDTNREPYFIELCKLHIMKVIYENEVKYFEGLNTGVGSFNLKVDEWNGANERLRELRQTLENYSVLNQADSVVLV